MSLDAKVLLLNCECLGQPDSLEQLLEAFQGMGFGLEHLRVGDWVIRDESGNLVSGVDASWEKFDDQMRRELRIAYDKRNLRFMIYDEAHDETPVTDGREVALISSVEVDWEVGDLGQPRQTRLHVWQSKTDVFTRTWFDREYYAQRFLGIGRRLYDVVHPTFGWVERVSPMKRLPGYTEFSDVESLSVPMIYWANFFGPEYVDKLGKEYLMNAPGWKVEELEDGGVLYVLAPNMAGTGPKAVVEQVKQYFGVDLVRRRRKK